MPTSRLKCKATLPTRIHNPRLIKAPSFRPTKIRPARPMIEAADSLFSFNQFLSQCAHIIYIPPINQTSQPPGMAHKLLFI